MAKPRFTEEKHIEIGRRLADVYGEIQSVMVEVGNAYPYTSTFYKELNKALTALSAARSEGDNESRKEHPEPWSAKWYYPGPRK